MCNVACKCIRILEHDCTSKRSDPIYKRVCDAPWFIGTYVLYLMIHMLLESQERLHKDAHEESIPSCEIKERCNSYLVLLLCYHKYSHSIV